jgi:hypothetical protein
MRQDLPGGPWVRGSGMGPNVALRRAPPSKCTDLTLYIDPRKGIKIRSDRRGQTGLCGLAAAQEEHSEEAGAEERE